MAGISKLLGAATHSILWSSSAEKEAVCFVDDNLSAFLTGVSCRALRISLSTVPFDCLGLDKEAFG
jgi:hypothetical protein